MAPAVKEPSNVSNTKKSAQGGSPEGGEALEKEHDHASEVKALPAGSRAHSVMVKAVVSEKAAMGEAQGVYTFIVAGHANKHEVARAVMAMYGVLPTAVRMQNRNGKQVARGRLFGRTHDTKRALVTLPKGKSIRVHEGV